MAAFLPLAASALIGGATGALGAQSNQPTQQQQNKQELIDQLMASLAGEGPYSDLFNLDEAAFQRSYVDPAKHMFESQIAPQIQQSFIASGQQRGTGLDDTLTRAGVDLDQVLNQQFAQMQNQAQQNKIGAIDTILGSDTGERPAGPTGSEAFFQGVGGAVSGEGFQQDFGSATTDLFTKKPQREGFETSTGSNRQGVSTNVRVKG